MSKRRAIPKKIRFEVFKRDSFTCQYCGAKAPDVLLEIDHIQPVSKGGTDDLLNLVTACKACNSGKGDRQLAQSDVLDKKRAQLEELQARKEQIEMMFEWQKSLSDLDEQVVENLGDYWADKTPGYVLNESGLQDLRKLLRQFGIDEIMHAMDIAADYYLEFENGKVTPDSFDIAFNKIGGICMVRRREREDPNIKRIYWIRGIVRRRCNYFNSQLALSLLQEAVSLGADLDELERHAKQIRNWTAWRSGIEDYIRALSEDFDA